MINRLDVARSHGGVEPAGEVGQEALFVLLVPVGLLHGAAL